MSEENELTEATIREDMGLPRRAVNNKTVEKPSLKERMDALETQRRERAADARRQRAVDAEVKAIWDQATGRRTLAEIEATTTEDGIRSRMHLPKRRRVD